MNETRPSRSFKDLLPWIIATIAVLALVLNLAWDRGDKSSQSDDVTVAELTERLDALESGGRPDGRGPLPGMAPGMTQGMPGGSDGEGGISGMGETKTAEQIAADREQQLRELEAQFAQDAKDPVGGAQTENTLVNTVASDTMKGTGLRANDVDIACKKNSCRIVGTFDKMGDAQDWSLFYITAAGGNVLSQTRMVFLPKPGGKTEVRIYSARAK